ncbi:hypothetical protein NH287_12225 [Microbacterium sp. CnD16-F]|uniref:hypothetical protein n=1 Tax=Microbacterium sp. CnD16-F TaxID=2954493 RepID=UPI00209823FF|nr:hypothetical protein [Microbacterium sp. CnD16-F]MCO7204249.1 hypothetical protein [Microbacterium sp. CnD16-F]
MTTFIEDSPRSFQAGWIGEAVTAGTATGAVITPWASPYIHRGGPGLKPGVGNRVRELRDAGVPVWFDATTHALQMPGVGDYRYYSEFNLWGGPVGDLTQDAYRREHVRRVFKHQEELSAPFIAPAPLLPSGLNNVSTLALETAKVALELQSSARLTIAGVGSFWSDGRDLDAHIGALASLDPSSGWFISFVQPDNDLPPKLTADEVYGICRTVRALSEYAPVHVSHGDFAALPAIAAGATTVGTGWDKRQRVVAFTDYARRAESTGVASWYERPSLVGLLGTLDRKADGALLAQQDATLTARLGGVPSVPGPKPSFLHHVAQLDAAVKRVQAAGAYQSRYEELDTMYTEASRNWAAVRAATGLPDRSAMWVTPFQQGLRMYGQSEGWIF